MRACVLHLSNFLFCSLVGLRACGKDFQCVHLHLHFVFVSIQPGIYVIYTTGPAPCEDNYEHIPHHQRGRRRSELILREIKIFGHWWAQRPESHNKWPVRFSVVPTHLSLLLSKNKARQENFFTSWNLYLVFIFLAVQPSSSHIMILSPWLVCHHVCVQLCMWYLEQNFIISLEPLKLHSWKVMKSAVCEMTMFEEEAANFSIGFSPLNNSNCRRGVFLQKSSKKENYQTFYPFREASTTIKKDCHES